MIVDVGLNFLFPMANRVNVTPNQLISVAQNGDSAVVMWSIVIAQLVLITNFWVNDGMLLVWKFHYLA
jgi:hypothetical protein